jgi:hypothetical protein
MRRSDSKTRKHSGQDSNSAYQPSNHLSLPYVVFHSLGAKRARLSEQLAKISYSRVIITASEFFFSENVFPWRNRRADLE